MFLFEQMLSDAEAHIAARRAQCGADKVILVGESMGGNIALQLGLRYAPQATAAAAAAAAAAGYDATAEHAGEAVNIIDGVVCVAPMIRIEEDVKPPAFLIPILKAASYVTPGFPFLESVVSKCFTYDEDTQRFIDDPLSYTEKIKMQSGFECLKATEYLNEQLTRIAFPLLILHGENDRVCPLAASKELVAKAASTKKELKTWHVSHAIWAEKAEDREPILDALLDFIKA